MKISEDYIITTDGSNNIMLNERVYKPIYEKQLQKDENGNVVKDKKGNDKEISIQIGIERTDNFKTIGYFGKVEILLERIINNGLIKDGMEDIESIIKLLKEIKEDLPKIAVMKQKELDVLKKDLESSKEVTNSYK